MNTIITDPFNHTDEHFVRAFKSFIPKAYCAFNRMKVRGITPGREIGNYCYRDTSNKWAWDANTDKRDCFVHIMIEDRYAPIKYGFYAHVSMIYGFHKETIYTTLYLAYGYPGDGRFTSMDRLTKSYEGTYKPHWSDYAMFSFAKHLAEKYHGEKSPCNIHPMIKDMVRYE